MNVFELVYIIEDNPVAAIITEIHLQQHGAFGRVQKYENGQRALDALLQAQAQARSAALPDLILLDLNMPVMDGWEFLEAFSAHAWPPAICVCILTSSIHPEEREKAQSFQAVHGYFSKPVDHDLLDQVVQLRRCPDQP